jgi:hypothetical protein
MGSYKVPQNVEADDKILGPLSMKQFIYAVIGVAYGALTFVVFKALILIWILVGLPPMLALLALGLYQREDQPLETYILAVTQFIFRPKQRLWEKEPIAEVFHIDPPPPKPEMVRRDPSQVRGQLSQLADLVDTRGWSAKQPEFQEPEESPVIDLQGRLGAEGVQSAAPVVSPLEALNPPQAVVGGAEITQADDILDTSSQSAENLNVLIENSVKSLREEAVENMRRQPATPAITATIAATPAPAITSAMTASPSDAILKLATEGGDLTVAQIAAQARRQQQLVEGQTVSLRDANPTA